MQNNTPTNKSKNRLSNIYKNMQHATTSVAEAVILVLVNTRTER